jgi:hypothetical protein
LGNLVLLPGNYLDIDIFNVTTGEWSTFTTPAFTYLQAAAPMGNKVIFTNSNGHDPLLSETFFGL